MGPHFFKCGKIGEHDDRPTGSVVLQWGRTFSSAESERSLAHAGAGGDELQWGRTFSSAERGLLAGCATKAPLASMGPHFFKCGKFGFPPDAVGAK